MSHQEAFCLAKEIYVNRISVSLLKEATDSWTHYTSGPILTLGGPAYITIDSRCYLGLDSLCYFDTSTLEHTIVIFATGVCIYKLRSSRTYVQTRAMR